MHKPKIGLALGGGAARGWSHIGVIEALTQAGIKPDIVCGTSMGALVGGVYASGRLAALHDWALKADRRIVTSLVDVAFMAGGLIDGVRIVEWLGKLEIAKAIEDLKIPYGAVATDVTTGREMWLRSGALDRAIRASIAMPGIFSPIQIDDVWMVDGGLVNPVPVSLCRAMGADFVIAVNVNEDLLGRRLVPEPSPEVDLPKPANLMELLKAAPAAGRRPGQFPPVRQPRHARLFRRAGQCAQHHAGPHHPVAPGGRAAACTDPAARGGYRPARLPSRRRGHSGRPGRHRTSPARHRGAVERHAAAIGSVGKARSGVSARGRLAHAT